jgi:hypothetical protein
MTRFFIALVFLISALTEGQECTSYAAIYAFDHKTSANIMALKAEDLEAKIDTIPAPVTSLKPLSRNRILVLIEVSGRDEDARIAGLVDGAVEVSKQAPDGLPVAFGVFGETTLLTDAFYTNAQERNANIDKIMSQAKALGKYPALYDALHEGLALFPNHEPGDTIVLVSDGYDNKSKRSDGDLEKEFRTKGTRLLIMTRPQNMLVKDKILQFNSRQDTSSWRTTSGKRTLMALASITGGAHMGFMNPKWFLVASTALVVGVDVPANMNKPKPWKLEVRDSANIPNGKPTLFYPYYIIPCEQKVVSQE